MLVYIGAVMVLFLFGIMLTRAQIGRERRPQQPGLGDRHPGRAGAARRARRTSIIDVFGDDKLPDPTGPTPDDRRSATTSSSPYLVPFLALSFILLAAAIGAIVLARKD